MKNVGSIGDILTASEGEKLKYVSGALSWYGSVLIFQGLWQLISLPFKRRELKQYMSSDHTYRVNSRF